MVFLSRVLWGKKLRNFMRHGFMDSLNVFVSGGAGGCGLPRYGGPGGVGGCVYCVGTEGASLASIKKTYPERAIRAGNGGNSSKQLILGSPGQDLKLEVPVGLSVIRDNTVLGEINEVGAEMILARGGPGGVAGNGWTGLQGQSHTLQLELRLIADVGLLGFPNAGKSTLLRAVSRARPRVANYPFTTVRPSIGTIEYPDLRQITMADLPGLVEGAHRNIGMGHRFLRHVERTKLLLMLVDIDGFTLSARYKHRTCLENILLLNKELELYNEELLTKPTLLVINKMDTPGADRKFSDLKAILNNIEDHRHLVDREMWPKVMIDFQDMIAISAKEATRVEELKDKIRVQLDLAAEREEVQSDELRVGMRQMITEKGPKLT